MTTSTPPARRTMDLADRVVLVARRHLDADRPDPAVAITWACAIPAMQDPTGRFLSALLLTTAYRDGDYLTDRLSEVYGLDHARTRHGLTLDHGLCCDGDCDCVPSTVRVGERCQGCDAAPSEAVDAAVQSLLLLIERAVSERAVADLAALDSLSDGDASDAGARWDSCPDWDVRDCGCDRSGTARPASAQVGV